VNSHDREAVLAVSMDMLTITSTKKTVADCLQQQQLLSANSLVRLLN